MNETNGAFTNGATNGSHSTTPAESSSVDAGVNGQASPDPGEPSLTSANPTEPKEPLAQPVEKILDESLDEQDIKVAITVTVHGRKIDIMNRPFEKTFYDGLESFNRGLLFTGIKKFLEEEIYQAVAVKINRKVPFVIPEESPLGEKQNGKPRKNWEPIPPYTGMGEDDEISLHTPPPDCRG
jgi:hypothetical protein